MHTRSRARLELLRCMSPSGDSDPNVRHTSVCRDLTEVDLAGIRDKLSVSDNVMSDETVLHVKDCRVRFAGF
jgi:hypothetical protein